MDVIAYLLFALFGLTMIKYDSIGLAGGFQASVISFKIGVTAFIGMLSYIVSFLIYLFIVRKYNLSFLLPFSNGVIVISSMFLGKFVFNEKISTLNVFGVVLIVAGLVLVSLRR